MIEILLALLLSLAVCALIMRRVEGDWTAPGAFFAAYWLLVCAIDGVLGPAEGWSWSAASWLVVAVASFCVGASFTRAPAAVDNIALPRRVHAPAMRLLILLCIAAGMVAVLLLSRWGGYSTAELGSLENLAALASELTVRRYSGVQEPAAASALMSAIYLGALLGGTLAALPAKRGVLRTLCIGGAFIPGIAVAVATTTKAPLMLSGILWMSAYISTNAVLQRKSHSVRIAMVALAAVALGTLAVIALLAWRYGVAPEDLASLIQEIRVDLFGSVAAFSVWFTTDASQVAPQLGISSFSGIAELLGLTKRITGVYDKSIVFSNIPTNIYTGFRHLIEDVGVAGALPMLLLLGNVFSMLRQAGARAIRITVPALALFYGVTLFSLISTCTIYTSICLAYVLYGAYWIVLVRTTEGFASEPRDQRDAALPVTQT